MQQNQTTNRNGAIDGLRALCIAAILIYHLNLPWLPSGHMGVVVFFVLSGYMATNAVVRLFDERGSFGVGQLLASWGKRLLRIMPSVIALVAIVGTLCATLNHVLFTKMRPDILPSLGAFLNWSYILRDVSYFDLVGGTSPLLHLWYIACDLQFFFAWTLVLALLLLGGKKLARWVAFLGAVLSAAWMAMNFAPGTDPSRVYYGTDTRAFSLLLGSWLALAFPLGKEPLLCRGLLVRDVVAPGGKDAGTRATVWAHLLGLVSLAGIACAMTLIPKDSPVWYWGGMFGLSLLAVVLIATLLAPTTAVGFLLGLAPLRVLGQLSFSLYLWHYPVFLLMGADKSTTPWWIRLLAVGISLAAAELSLELVERPYALKKRTADAPKVPWSMPKKAVTAACALAVIACGGVTYHAYTTLPDETLVPEEALVSTGVAAAEARNLAQEKHDAQQDPQQAEQSEQSSQTQDEKPSENNGDHVEVTETTIVSAPAAEVAANKYDPVLVGDSVPGDAGDVFVPGGLGWETRLPDALIDTFIGRNPSQALDVLKGYLDQGVVGNVIVMACFSNSTPYPETLDAMIEAAGPKRSVYLVGTVNPDGFQNAANANLQDAASRYDNVHYVDWPKVLEGHMDEYLWADDTHLRPAGAKVYVDMIVRAVAQDLVDAGGTTAEAQG